MPLKQFEITHFRNIERAQIRPGPGLNLFFGANAAGKTSILEAVSVLSSLRSFRSPHLTELIHHNQEGFRLTAQVIERDERVSLLGIQRDKDGLLIKSDGEKVSRTSELSSRLPVQTIHPDSHYLVSGGPKHRRRFLDWGVFHVEHQFLPAWRRYERALKQRNAALRSGQGWQMAAIWDSALAEAASVVHECRQRYIHQLGEALPEFAQHIGGTETIAVDYRPGWDTSKRLQEVLEASRNRDISRGFTCSGPHRAELVFKVDGKQAENYISRGQQKMLVFALLLSQVKLFSELKQQPCVVLLDDLAAELDSGHQQKVLQALRQLSAQVFITAIDSESISVGNGDSPMMFHVEHGQVEEVL